MDIYKIWENYLNTLKKYAVFSGRAGRAEYWWFFLVNLIVSVALSVFDSVIGVGLLNGLYSVAVFVPSLAVGVRRLHDVGKSGWFLLIALIPIVGWIILIVKLAKKGHHGENKYGPVPAAI